MCIFQFKLLKEGLASLAEQRVDIGEVHGLN